MQAYYFRKNINPFRFHDQKRITCYSTFCYSLCIIRRIVTNKKPFPVGKGFFVIQTVYRLF